MRLAGLALALLGAGACVEHLPPPQPPPNEPPNEALVPAREPAPGNGRVLLDAHGDRAEVAVVSATDDPSIVAVTPLCTTPCVIDLPYGSHPLLFHSTTDPARESAAEVDIGPRPKVVRHALGERREGGTAHTTGTALIVLGAIAATTGLILWSAGSGDDARHGVGAAGQVMTFGGAATAILGIPLVLSDRPSERPGATTEWSLPSRHEGPVPLTESSRR